MTHNKDFLRISVPTHTSVELLSPKRILYCESQGRYADIKVHPSRKLKAVVSLKTLEKLLKSFLFVRCHSRYLINLEYVQSYSHKNGQLIMENGALIPVAKDRKPFFYKLLRELTTFSTLDSSREKDDHILNT